MRTIISPVRWPMLSIAHDSGGGVVSQGFFNGTYTTNFDSNENPLSGWLMGQTPGVDWGDCQASGGVAYGKRAQTFRDNTALRPTSEVYSNNQYAQGVLWKGSPVTQYNGEAELRLRSLISANNNRGIEVTWSMLNGASAYHIIVNWDGPVGAGNFVYLFEGHGSQYEVANGDILGARIVGDTITSYRNGVDVQSVSITVGGTNWTSGQPGWGTNCDTADGNGASQLDQYGFSSFTAGPA